MENGSYKFNADYLKLKEIFDFMVDEYTYTSTKTTSTLNLHNSYGAIVGEYGSCTGLSKAFKTVCDQLEYICITAKVKNSQNITHMCNFVYMDGNWYMVDLANAINNSNNADDYFMVPLSNGLVLVNNTVYTLDVSEFAYPPLDSVSYIHLMGDVTLDNELTEDDADLVLAYVLNSAIGFSSRQKLLADLDNDGILTANDAAWIYQLILLQGNNRHYSQRTNGEFGIESDSEMIDSMYEGVNRIFAEMGLPLVSRDTIVSVMGGVDNES